MTIATSGNVLASASDRDGPEKPNKSSDTQEDATQTNRKKGADPDADRKKANRKKADGQEADKAKPEPGPTAEAASSDKTEKPANITLSGVFESIQATELAADTEEITTLKIRRIVPHGTVVRQGQTLVWFETKEIDRKIKAAEVSLRLAKIDMEAAEFADQQFARTQKLDIAAAQRSRQSAQQAYDNFLRVDKDRNVASAEFNLKSYRASYDNALEELQQLTQMYQEDELTEASEEIVLKRAQQAVDSAKFRFEGAEITTQRTLKQSLPRDAATQEDTFTRAEMSYEKALRNLQTARLKHDIELQKKRDTLREQAADLKTMQAERAHLLVTAPHAGIVYHGPLTRGKVSDKASTLKAGSSATPSQVLITLVNPKRLRIRTDLTEAQLGRVTSNMDGTATPGTNKDNQLSVRIKTIGSIPYANNKFDCVISLRKGRTTGLIPGTTCTVTLPTAASEQAE